MDHGVKSFLSPQTRPETLNHHVSQKGIYVHKNAGFGKKSYNYHVDEYERQEQMKRQERMKHRERIIAQRLDEKTASTIKQKGGIFGSPDGV